MKQPIRLFVIFLTFSGILLLTACSGGGRTSVTYGVYSGYGSSYYGSNNDNYYYYNRRTNINRPNRPNRPIRPNRPSTRPAFGGGMSRPAGGMGRPSGMGRGGGRGGGGRGRR